jgi:hypothetical protein
MSLRLSASRKPRAGSPKRWRRTCVTWRSSGDTS